MEAHQGNQRYENLEEEGTLTPVAGDSTSVGNGIHVRSDDPTTAPVTLSWFFLDYFVDIGTSYQGIVAACTGGESPR